MQLLFPHETIRESQKELTEQILETIKNKSSLIAHAPTGLGKTAASISAALTYAIENNLSLIFVTPKHTQHKIAVETLKAIKEKYNLKFLAIDLIGKRNMCAQPGASAMHQSEFSDYCMDAVKNKKCDFYNNVHENKEYKIKKYSVLKELENNILHVEELKEIASKNLLCPFEVSMILGSTSKAIIADYNHLLNESIRSTIFEKIGKELEKTIIIFDEAHGIPKKCRELLSSQLSTLIIDLAAKEAKKLNLDGIAEEILKLRNILEKLISEKTTIENNESLIKKEEFINLVKKTFDYDEFINNLKLVIEVAMLEKKKTFSSSILSFLINWEGPDQGFARIIKKGFTERGKPIIHLTYKCMDPSFIMKPLVEGSYSSILMSGTLTPTEMYKDLMGINAKGFEYKNPFPKQNKLNIIVPETTTKYTERSDEMYKKIAEYCASITNNIPGNTAIFFPSYKISEDINKYFKSICNKTIFTEYKGMSKGEKTDFIEKFKQYEKSGAVLLAVSSGNFGEGIDFPKNVLKCVIVVGIPLEKPDLETQELIRYYDYKFNKGWDYGYIMPALIRSLQNAGRCIRSETDKGVIIYLDKRYVSDTYFKCFPKDSNLRITKEPIPRIKEFFAEHNIIE